MHNEVNTIKKKRIILSTNRKSVNNCKSTAKELPDIHHKQTQEELMNCISSINNSLEIFEDDPKNRHFHFLENQEDKIQSQSWLREQPINDQGSQYNEKSKLLFSKKQRPLQEKNTDFSTISILNTDCSKFSQMVKIKKLPTSPNRKYIDLTLKRVPSKVLSNNSSMSYFSNRVQQKNWNVQNYDNRSTQRSILSSVSVSSLHLTIVSRSNSQRKKPSLTITCHKYKENKGDKKMKDQSVLNKWNSIKLFKKCI